VTTQGLLSRLAESLFWIGRYVERADDTSRIVDAYLHRLLEDPFEDESLACQSLLAIMGLEIGPEVVATTEGVMSALAFDPSNPSAIVGSWRSAYENSMGSRDVISSEMWECINTTWVNIPSFRSQSVRLGPHVFLRGIRDRAALFAGLTDATMSRSDPWRFVALGRALERVDMTTRLLSVRVTAGGHAPNWPTLLRAAGAEEAFLQAHVGVDEPQRIAEFLLLDRLFPRSIFHALSVAETCLSELETTQNRSGVTDPARRIIGQTKTALEYMDSDRLLPELAESLERISEACAAASVAIAQRYFGSITTVEWKAEQG
jgi:uncharacterized alpha-E superfamily protein